MTNFPAPQQAILEHYSKWLAATFRQLSDFNGMLFARKVTTLRRDRFIGMTVLEICKVIGANVALADTSWGPPPFIRVSNVALALKRRSRLSESAFANEPL